MVVGPVKEALRRGRFGGQSLKRRAAQLSQLVLDEFVEAWIDVGSLRWWLMASTLRFEPTRRVAGRQPE